jgi:hypothetical protein
VSPPVPHEVVERALAASTAHGRADLAARLRASRARLLDPSVRVLVVGEFKQGKSQLVNALVNAPVCPVDDDVATAVPMVVRHGDAPSAVLVLGEADTPLGATGRRREVPIDRLAEHVAESADPRHREDLDHVEVTLPRAILAGGLALVDTPGVGGLGSAHGAATTAALATADAVLVVSSAAQDYTAAELDFLRQAVRLCPTVACVLTKTDLHPDWREVAARDTRRLRDLGVPADLIPVSSALRLAAARTGDAGLNAESGFPALVSHLRTRIVGQAERLALRSASHDVLVVTDQLAASLNTELTAQLAPERAAELVGELEVAGQRAAQLRQRGSRWQQALGDGVADLIADVDHDLRERMRAIGRVAERELDEIDPAAAAEEFSAWLRQKVAAAASATFVWTMQRAEWLAGQVAEHFAEDGRQALPEIGRGDRASPLASVGTFRPAEAERFGIGQRLVVGMRGGYGGTLMFGMLGSLAGLALINPVSVAAGLLLGGKTVRDERKRMLQRRQAEAKNAVRRHLDDVVFQVSKECRDLLREIQRTLRDHFTARAEEVQRSLADSLTAARNAVKTDRAQREARVRDLRAELTRVADLARTAELLDPGPPGRERRVPASREEVRNA